MTNQGTSLAKLYAQARAEVCAAVASPWRAEVEQLYAAILDDAMNPLSYIDLLRTSQERFGAALTHFRLGLLQQQQTDLSRCFEELQREQQMDAAARGWLESFCQRFSFPLRRALEVSHLPRRWRLLVTNFAFFDLQKQLRTETSIVRADGASFQFQSIGEDFIALLRHWTEKLVELSQHEEGQRFVVRHAPALRAIRDLFDRVLQAHPPQSLRIPNHK